MRTASPLQILGTDYKKGVLKWIDEDNLPTWLGGKSEGSLIDDIGPWNDAELCNKIGVDIDELKAGKKLQPLFHLGTLQSRRYAAAAVSSAALAAPSSVRISADGPRRDSAGSSGFQSPRGSNNASR